MTHHGDAACDSDDDESLAEFDAVDGADVRALAASLLAKLDCRALVLPAE